MTCCWGNNKWLINVIFFHFCKYGGYLVQTGNIKLCNWAPSYTHSRPVVLLSEMGVYDYLYV